MKGTDTRLKLPTILCLTFYILAGILYLITLYNYDNANEGTISTQHNDFLICFTLFCLFYLTSKLFIYIQFLTQLYFAFPFTFRITNSTLRYKKMHTPAVCCVCIHTINLVTRNINTADHIALLTTTLQSQSI